MRLWPTLCCLVLSLSALTACSQEGAAVAARTEPDETIAYADTDTRMTGARNAAKASVSHFWSRFQNRTPDDDTFLVKLGLDDAEGNVEHIWARVLSRADGAVKVALVNEPVNLPRLTEGSEITMNEERISDWSYERDGKLFGNFTTRAMLKDMQPDEARALTQALSPRPLPADIQ